MKQVIKKLIPKGGIAQLHRGLTYLAAWRAGFPSRKLIVIGVTGTNGKSTVVQLISHILESAGQVPGYATTVSFKVGLKNWMNTAKMTMLGRGRLQKLLAEMVGAGCRYAIIETSSEGLAQYRHAGLAYDVAVFTNLTPEHIESHGSFEAYKKAKGKLFSSLQRAWRKQLPENIPTVSVVNGDDAHAGYYAQFVADKKYIFSRTSHAIAPDRAVLIRADQVKLGERETTFRIKDVEFHTTLLGLHNVENILAAVATCVSQGLSLDQIAAGISSFSGVPGRMEWIDEGQSFKILVDYAPEPASMEALYRTVESLFTPEQGRIIHVLGSAGGGRDAARRPVLGALAARHAGVVIVTNEDPYDEDPLAIMEAVATGARSAGKVEGRDLFVVPDRKEALYRALAMAQSGDLVIATGKGSEQAIVGPKGTMTPWDEREVLRTLCKTLQESRK